MHTPKLFSHICRYFSSPQNQSMPAHKYKTKHTLGHKTSNSNSQRTSPPPTLPLWRKQCKASRTCWYCQPPSSMYQHQIKEREEKKNKQKQYKTETQYKMLNVKHQCHTTASRTHCSQSHLPAARLQLHKKPISMKNIERILWKTSQENGPSGEKMKRQSKRTRQKNKREK